MSARILIVEDDAAIGRGLRQVLEDQGHRVDWVRTGADAIGETRGAVHDLVLLDLGLPDIDGVGVCREIRRVDPGTTIVMLTARVAEIDIVVGLDAGADDYVTKPFRVGELAARVRAHLRRRETSVGGAPELTVGPLKLEQDARRVWLDGREVALRAKEFDLLALLMSEAGRVITRERIMSEVWDEHWFGSTKTLDMHISALRRKLGDPADEPGRITTLRGVGYRFEQP
jgi:DNA-binding response OmpR family regulator